MVHHGRPSRSSWTESVRSSFSRTVMGKATRESSVGTRLGKNPNWECSFVSREKGLFLSVCVKLAGKKHNIDPMWIVLMKDVDLGEPTSFLDHVYLGCTQWERQTSKDIVDNYRNMYVSKISAGATEKPPSTGKLDANISSCYDMEGHAKKCVERYYELANKTTQQQRKVATPCLDDHQVKEEVGSIGVVKSLLTNCSEMLVFGAHW